MTLFYIKKSFFDGWDNLLGLVLFNLGVILILAVGAYLPLLFGESWQATLASVFLAVVLLSLYNGGVAYLAKEMAFYQRPDFRELFVSIRSAFPQSLILGVINASHLLLLTLVVPFYYQLGGVMGLAALSLIFWISVAWWLASQWFYPLMVQLPGKTTVLLKKCFLLLFDNPGFTFFMAIHGTITMLISIVTALLMPGMSSVVMARQGALRLLLYKYNYLEENPEADRKKIPWDALLIEEQELIGRRTLKGMIFPWKE
jgi:hypothetical protein